MADVPEAERTWTHLILSAVRAIVTATVLAGAVLMSGWLSIAMGGGGKWSG